MRKMLGAVAVLVTGAVIAAAAFIVTQLSYTAVQQANWVMEPTLHKDDRVVARKLSGGEVQRGDVVLVAADAWGEEMRGHMTTWRVAGIAGDTVACCDVEQRITVNGKSVTEDYRSPEPPRSQEYANQPFSATVPTGHLFVLGDSRGNSRDSREEGRGPLPTDAVVGVVIQSGGERLEATTAFTAAGLPGAPFEDELSVVLFAVMVGGGVVAAGGLVWLIVTLRRQNARQLAHAS